MNLILECEQQDKMALLSQVKLVKPAISNQQSFITVSKKSINAQKLIMDINKYLIQIKQDGTYKKIIDKFFGKHELE